MYLLDIVFQSGDFYNSSSNFWSSTWAALLGTGTALFVFYLGIRHNRRKEDKQKKENDKNTLVYLYSLIVSISKISIGQTEENDKLCDEMTNDAFRLPLLRQPITEDINRANNGNNERFFNAYINTFGNDKERIKIFKLIFTHLAYIPEANRQAKEVVQGFLTAQHSRLLRYKDLTEEQTLYFCGVTLNNIRNKGDEYNNGEFYKSINSIIENFYKGSPNHKTVPNIQTNLIEPLNKEMIERFRNIDEALRIIDTTRKATQLFEDMKRHSDGLIKAMQMINEELKNTIVQLIELTKDLESI